MTHAAKLARADAFTDALRAANEAIGQEKPEPQAFRIIAAIQALRELVNARVNTLTRIDYLERVQREGRIAWAGRWRGDRTGPEHDATAGVETPLGRLKTVVWRRAWTGAKRGARVAWAAEYYLNDEPITIVEIRAAGLAQRPTTRRRQRKDRAA